MRAGLRGSPARLELVTGGTHSRMGDFGEVMTVRQLIDIVAFLHERYRVVPPPDVK